MNSTLFEHAKLNKLIFKEVECYFHEDISKSVLYSKKLSIDSQAYNYINSICDPVSDKIFKPIVEKTFLECEQDCPGMGDVVLNIIMTNLNLHKYIFKIRDDDQFEAKIIKPLDELEKKIINMSKNFNHDDLNNFISKDITKDNRLFINELLKLMSLKTRVYIKAGVGQKTTVRLTNDLTFDVEFDKDFLIKDKWEETDYNFIIIDGFIDSIGEIHHLLAQANENMEPYVIFCKGMRLEVKNAIIQNLMRGTINVLPISLESNELNINLLADIAACHGSDVVSHLKGETISMAVRRQLAKGKKISVNQQGFTITPTVDKVLIDSHLRYLSNRKKESKLEVNTNFLDQRLKMMSCDKIVIRLGAGHLSDKIFTQDLNKSLVMIKQMLRGCFKCDNIDYFKKYFISCASTVIAISVIKKAKSILTLIYNTSGCIIFN